MKANLTDFDENEYLAANPDVAQAIRDGSIKSGSYHYQRFGFDERRAANRQGRPAPLSLPFDPRVRPSRRDKILANLDLKSLEGLEIGALSTPLVQPVEGNIFFVDHAKTDELKEKYRDHASVDTDYIVEVDAVWGPQTLQECIGVGRKVDYVVASHVIEHVPDFITWLQEIHSILRPGGSVRLAIPDRRYSFDILRFESRPHDVLDAYLRRVRVPMPRLLMEHMSLVREVDCRAAWNGKLDIAGLKRYHLIDAGITLARDTLTHQSYHDCHCWVFTPISFADLCKELAIIDLLGFVCDFHFETVRDTLEFFVSMTPSSDKAAIIASWDRMKDELLRSATYQKSSQDLIEIAARGR